MCYQTAGAAATSENWGGDAKGNQMLFNLNLNFLQCIQESPVAKV
jgi:hypothetical protein